MPDIEEQDCDLPQEDPIEDFCGSPVCNASPRRSSRKDSRKQSNATTKSLKSFDMTSDEQDGECSEKKPPEECGSKTCPYLKKLVFCEDCGGVLPDEDTPTTSTTEITNSVEGTAGSVAGEGDTKAEAEPVSKKDDQLFKKEEIEDKAPVRQTVSLYSYPGVQIGHKDCDYRRRLIPRNMGWLWNHIPSFGNPEFWRGYKPGAVLKSVYKIMKKHRKDFDPNEIKKKRSKSRMRLMDLKHCIEVKKKEGDYLITVNPVKDPQTRNPLDNPYMDVSPMQFKIEKERPEPAVCPCDEMDEKSEVSTEFDFHFTPPAAIPETFVKKKKNKVEAEAQYNVMDLPPELRAAARGKGGKGSKKGGKKGKKK